jgi:steroid 5-alpha reductase family enzyme
MRERSQRANPEWVVGAIISAVCGVTLLIIGVVALSNSFIGRLWAVISIVVGLATLTFAVMAFNDVRRGRAPAVISEKDEGEGT